MSAHARFSEATDRYPYWFFGAHEKCVHTNIKAPDAGLRQIDPRSSRRELSRSLFFLYEKLDLWSCRHMRGSPIPQTDTPLVFGAHEKSTRTFSFTFLPVECKNRSSGETFNSTTSTDPVEEMSLPPLMRAPRGASCGVCRGC